MAWFDLGIASGIAAFAELVASVCFGGILF
jgi:hypothetical protein